MTTRIERVERDGSRWVIEGNSKAELEVGISALHTALDASEAQSNHRVPEVEKENPAPQTATTPAPQTAIGGKEKPHRKRRRKSTVRDNTKRLHTALKLLKTIAGAGESGASASDIAKAIGYEDGKGFGPVMGQLGRVLTEMGLKLAKVFLKTGWFPNVRWIAQSEMEVAITKVEQAIKTAR